MEYNDENSISQSFKSLYTEEASKDFKLIVGYNYCVMVHKLILTSRCNYFKRMLEHNTSERQHNQVVIRDFELPVIKAFVKYLYTEEIDDMEELAKDLIVLADKYGMNYLKQKAELHLIGKISKSTAVDYLIDSDMYNCQAMKARSLSIIQNHLRAIKKSKDFKKLHKYPHLLNAILDFVTEEPNEERARVYCLKTVETQPPARRTRRLQSVLTTVDLEDDYEMIEIRPAE